MINLKGFIKYIGLIEIIFTTSLLATVLCLIGFDRQNGYEILFLMPLVFLFCFLFLASKRQYYYETINSITGAIVLIVYYIRMVITPLALYFGNYQSIIEGIFNEWYPFAIVMICMECFVVIICLPYLIHKEIYSFNNTNNQPINLVLRINRPRKQLWIIVLFMVAFMIMVFSMDDSIIRHMFLSLIDTEKEYYALTNSQSGLGTLSMYVELVSACFSILQVILPPMILWYVVYSKMYRGLKYFLSFLIFCVVTVVATENRIYSIFAAMAILITMKNAYGYRFDNQFYKWLVLIFLVCVYGLSIKSGVINNELKEGVDFSNISSMLCAYFSGVPTCAAGFYMINTTPEINILYLPIDIVNRIPFLGYIINLVTGITLRDSNQLFNNFIASYLGRNVGQILPTTSVGYEYYFLLFPLASYFMIRLACKFESKSKKQTNIVMLNLFHWITICVACSPVVASSLLMTTKISWFFFIYIFLSVFNKNRKNA